MSKFFSFPIFFGEFRTKLVHFLRKQLFFSFFLISISKVISDFSGGGLSHTRAPRQRLQRHSINYNFFNLANCIGTNDLDERMCVRFDSVEGLGQVCDVCGECEWCVYGVKDKLGNFNQLKCYLCAFVCVLVCASSCLYAFVCVCVCVCCVRVCCFV